MGPRLQAIPANKTELRPGPSGELVFRSSRRKTFLYFLAAFVLTVVSVWVLWGKAWGSQIEPNDTPAWVLWFCAGFFSCCAAGLFLQLILRKNLFLRLSSHGLEFASWFRSYHYAWQDIDDVWITRMNLNKVITFDLRLSESKKSTLKASSVLNLRTISALFVGVLRLVGRAPTFFVSRARLGNGGIILNMYDTPLEEILEALKAWKARYGSNVE